LDHGAVLQEIGAIDVVAVTEEDVQPEPLLGAEVRGEAFGADRVPRDVRPAHPLGVTPEVLLRRRRSQRERDVTGVQKSELANAVGPRRTAGTAGVGPAVDALLEE